MEERQSEKLRNAVQITRKKIQQLKDKNETIGEQNTKAALIDPILASLGWDLSDLDEVQREYKRKRQDKPVDYALFIVKSPCLFVEAKELHKDLSDRKRISQILGYATVVGVQWCVLTNGDEYRLYNSHAPVDVEKKLFRKIEISDADREDYVVETLDLLSRPQLEEKRIDVLWKAQFVDNQVRTAVENIFQDKEKALVNLIRRRAPDLSPAEIRDSLNRIDVQATFPFPIVTAPLVGETRPSRGSIATKQVDPRIQSNVRPIHLIQAGLINPPFELQRTYHDKLLTSTIQKDGTVLFNKQVFSSLSQAAIIARKSVINKKISTNGWRFWRYRDATTGELRKLSCLRDVYLQKHL